MFKCFIPPGTLLYRKADDNKIHENMFFGFDTIGIDTSKSKQKKVQLWKTVIGIESFLLVNGRYASGRFESSISNLYQDFCGDNSLCNGQIKCYDNKNRKAFLEFLNNNFQIDNWITPVDGAAPMEFFSFSDKKSHQFKFVKYFVSDDTEKNTFSSVELIEEVPMIVKSRQGNFEDGIFGI